MTGYIPSSPGGAAPGPPAAEKIVAELHSLRRQYRQLVRTPQLTSSSIDDGAVTLVTDGTVGGYVGTQYDGTTGTVTVNGPTPPIPSAPEITSVLGGVRVRWDGTFEDPQSGYASPIVAPSDFKGVEVHLADEPDFDTAGFGTMRGAITSARGGDFTDSSFKPGTQVWARLVTRSSAGNVSPPSVSAGPISAGQVALGDLGFDLASYAGGTKIYYGGDGPAAPPGGFVAGDLWLRTISVDDSGVGQYQTFRWDGIDWRQLEVAGVGSALASALAATHDAANASELALAAQTSVDSKITAFYSSTTPAGAEEGDFWVRTPDNQLLRFGAGTWHSIQDAGISQALADAGTAKATADGKVRIFVQASTSTPTATGVGDLWIQSDQGNRMLTWTGALWTQRLLGNGAISPNSLIASNVLVTGTVTAALLETLLVLTTTLQAGPSNGGHATVQSDGFHLFGLSSDGVSEVGRMATGTNDFFGFTDQAGNLVANWDATGYLSGSGANFTGDIIVSGRALSSALAAATGSGNGQGTQSGAQNWYGYNFGAGVGGVTTEYGLIEVPVWVDTARMYLLIPDLAWNLTDVRAQLDVRVRDGGTSQPSITTTPLIYYRQFGSETVGYDITASGPGLWQPTGASGIRQHRLLLSVAAGGTGAVNINGGVGGLQPPSLFVLDLGPAKPTSNTLVNRGGGTLVGVTTPPPGGSSSQQYDTGWMSPTSRATYRGDGGLRNDTTDVIQGWDPSGYNGDGYGYVGFSLPSITGTVDSVQVRLPWNWAYFNSGGTAVINVLHSGSMTPAGNFVANKMKGNWNVGLSGKSGSVDLTVPGDWFSLFANASSPRASFIGFGPSGGSNETYYVRFTGPSIQLRILYTQ